MVSTKKAAPNGNGQTFKQVQVTKNPLDNYNLIPLKSDKSPDLPSWSKDHHNGNIKSKTGFYGLVCGPTSDFLHCIDVDCKYDQTGTLYEDYTTAIKSQIDVLKRCSIQTTMNGGYHLIFKCKELIGNLKLAQKANNEVLIETRGYGGYFAIHPSPGYEITYGDPVQLPYLETWERDILLNSAKLFDQRKPVVTHTKIPEFTGTSPFEEYNQRGDALSLLLNHGWNEVYKHADKIALRRPGKNESVSATWYTDDQIFYCFTTSTEFEGNRGYNQAQIFTILEHGGDYSEAAKSLIRAGYGSIEAYKPEATREPKKVVNPFNYESFTAVLQRAESLPPLKQMFGSLVYENTISIWFGDNGTAKTFVGMSVANSMAKGKKPLDQFTNEVGTHKVIYHDYELTDRQLENRFKNYPFSDNLIRGTIDYSIDLTGVNIGELLIKELEGYAKQHDRVTVFVDNISVFDDLDLENRKQAGRLLAELNRLKKMYPGLTIIILAHTPKVEKGPILKEHLAGSKQLSNLIDSSIGLAKAESDQDLFYMKQLKQRNGKIEYHYQNVISFCLSKVDTYLIPIFRGYGLENTLLKTPKDEERRQRNEVIISKYEDGVSAAELAKDLGVSRQAIYKIINGN